MLIENDVAIFEQSWKKRLIQKLSVIHIVYQRFEDWATFDESKRDNR